MPAKAILTITEAADLYYLVLYERPDLLPIFRKLEPFIEVKAEFHLEFKVENPPKDPKPEGKDWVDPWGPSPDSFIWPTDG